MPDINDHDLLIELRTEMRGLRTDVSKYNDTTAAQLLDHETRIRAQEAQSNQSKGGLYIIQAIISVVVSVCIAILFKKLGL